MCYLDGSKESENLSAKQIIVKLKEDFAVICGDPKPVKKKKLFGGGLFGVLKKRQTLIRVTKHPLPKQKKPPKTIRPSTTV